MFKALKHLARRDGGTLTGKTVMVNQRHLKVEQVVGEGGFATIYRCTDCDTGKAFALKLFLLT